MTVSFSEHVRPLFREEDREGMSFLFDLWSYDEARENAVAIVERLENKTMPCDQEWPDEQIAVVRAWLDQGCAP